ncbi:DLRB2 protein, partial [Polypterus senegalus]
MADCGPGWRNIDLKPPRKLQTLQRCFCRSSSKESAREDKVSMKPRPMEQPKGMSRVDTGRGPVSAVHLPERRVYREGVICYGCNQKGHIHRNCPKKRETKLCFEPCPLPTKKTPLVNREKMVRVTIAGRQHKALIDTGSTQSLVRRECLEGQVVESGQSVVLRCVHGEEVTYPLVRINLEIKGVGYELPMGIVDNMPYPVLLGLDVPGIEDLLQSALQAEALVVTRAQAAKQKERSHDNWDELPFSITESPRTYHKARSQRRQEKLWGVPQKAGNFVPPPILPGDVFDIPSDVAATQRDDPSLLVCFDKAARGLQAKTGEKFVIEHDILYHQDESGQRLVLPKNLRDRYSVGDYILKSAEMSEIEETLKRIQSHKGVVGTIVVNAQGIPIRTTLDNSTTLQYTALLRQITILARGTVRDIDPQNDLTFLRMRSKKHEVMVGVDKDFLFVVVQAPSE